MRVEAVYTLTAPLSHIGKASSNGTLFQKITTGDGLLPIVTANSIRGKLRDCGALYMLNTLDCTVNKNVFDVLFSGGNIAETMKTDIGRIKEIKKWFPFVNLFGGAIWDVILQGGLTLTNAEPQCVETGDFTGVSWRDLIGEIEYTRTDDKKNHEYFGLLSETEAAETSSKASQQMRYSVQYLTQGAKLKQHITIKDDLLGVFLSCLDEWGKAPLLGGMSNKGFGSFDAKFIFTSGDMAEISNGNLKLSDNLYETLVIYREFLTTNKDTIINNLKLLDIQKSKENKKNAKINNSSSEDNSFDE